MTLQGIKRRLNVVCLSVDSREGERVRERERKKREREGKRKRGREVETI